MLSLIEPIRSDTKTHQIAARKVEQMKTLKAALGLGTLDDSKQVKEEISDMNELTIAWTTKAINQDVGRDNEWNAPLL